MSAVLFVSSESAAISGAKVGGVADVVAEVSTALARITSASATSVQVVLPEYACLTLAERTLCGQYSVNFAGHQLTLSLYRVLVAQGVTHYVLSHPWLNSAEVYHNDTDNRPFAADASKFALFCLGVAEAIKQGAFGELDVLHLHDWHSATLAVLRAFAPQYECLQGLRTVYTVHNLALQGTRPFSGDESSLQTWFPWLGYDGQQICDPHYQHCYNPMRAAITLCDKIHLVSPTYVEEVLQPSDPERGFIGGEGLEGELQKAHQQGRLVGILNGCDYEQEAASYPHKALWPLTQQALFTAMAKLPQLSSGHYIAHVRMQQWQQLQIKPWLGSVGRVTSQKVALLAQRLAKPMASSDGTLVIDAVLDELAKEQKHFIMLGSGDSYYEQLLTQAMARHDNFLFINGFSLALSDAIYELCELFFMPSSFEPCGISQMLALRSGTPCLVHGVGGLKDTVKEGESGFVFNGDSPTEQGEQLLACLTRALDMHKDQPQDWQQLCANARECRFSWHEAAKAYLSELYGG
ncbi:glycogen synthase [Pseudoalteromonas sp. T1lg76]|uniref:glycogen synthase n=1 Tax=Pseudoalteromonas sp. T1lg76 TaxID=2077103 RepID=UPI000CF6EB2C|nr:glycogen/starch synthase [Pseudoalteromonas sp. T1lg76]